MLASTRGLDTRKVSPVRIWPWVLYATGTERHLQGSAHQSCSAGFWLCCTLNQNPKSACPCSPSPDFGDISLFYLAFTSIHHQVYQNVLQPGAALVLLTRQGCNFAHLPRRNIPSAAEPPFPLAMDGLWMNVSSPNLVPRMR